MKTSEYFVVYRLCIRWMGTVRMKYWTGDCVLKIGEFSVLQY